MALVPIAIELAAHPNTYKEPTPTTAPKSGTVFSRSKLLNSGQKNMWDLAKLVFRSLDVGVHQLISHWLRCHAAIEPFLIALKRCISMAHPVSYLVLQGCNQRLDGVACGMPFSWIMQVCQLPYRRLWVSCSADYKQLRQKEDCCWSSSA